MFDDAVGFGNPKRVRNSSSERKSASGAEPMGRLIAVGIMPVAVSSAGSRTSIRMGVEEGEGEEGEEGRVGEICLD